MAINLFPDGYYIFQKLDSLDTTSIFTTSIGYTSMYNQVGLFEVVDLNNFTWNGNSCTFTIAWSSGQYNYQGNLNLGNITIKFSAVPDSCLIDGVLNESLWKNHIKTSSLRHPGTVYDEGRVVGLAYESSGGRQPFSCEVTVTSSSPHRYYEMVIYAPDAIQPATKTWLTGGITVQNKIQIDRVSGMSAANVETLIRSRTASSNIYNATVTAISIPNNTVYYDWYEGSSTSAMSRIGSGSATATSCTLLVNINSPKGIYYYKCTMASESYVSFSFIKSVAIIDPLSLVINCNGTSYSSDATISNITSGSTPVIYGDASSADLGNSLGIYYKIGSGNYSTVSDGVFIGTPITSNTVYEIRPCSIQEPEATCGDPIYLTLQVAATPDVSFSLSNVSSTQNSPFVIQVSNITIRNVSSGTLEAYVTGPNLDTSDDPVTIWQYTTSSSIPSNITFNLADLIGGIDTTPNLTSLSGTFKIWLMFSASMYAYVDYVTIEPVAPSVVFYNQFANSNILISNDPNYICRKIRTVVSYEDSLLQLGTNSWGIASTNTQNIASTIAKTINTTNKTLTSDTTLQTLPQASASIQINVFASLLQSGLINSSKHLSYTYEWSTTKNEVGRPNTSTAVALNPNVINYFSTNDSDTLSFSLPSGVNANNGFATGASLAWSIQKSSTNVITGVASNLSFVWNGNPSFKTAVQASEANRYGVKSNLGLSLKLQNRFGENFVFNINLSINYNALLSSFTLSVPSSLTNGTPVQFTYNLGRTTYETLTILTYVNGTQVLSTSATATAEQVVTANYTPNLSTENASIYGVVIHSQSDISNQQTTTTVIPVQRLTAPTIRFTSATYNTTNKTITYSYIISDWGSTTVPTVSVSLTDGTHTISITSPSSSNPLPQTINGTVDVTTWNLSQNTDVYLAITSTASGTSISSRSNIITILIGQTPTVSYRPNYVSINNPSPQANATFEVDTLGARTTIVFRSTTYLIEFNPSTGTIDYKPLS